ncbi:hypothetical protein NQZ79_g4889 [Umbelopsis isabellina]|nr:hypothetical protein NQZ79_g4889 [Umbelopsis isabellina]
MPVQIRPISTGSSDRTPRTLESLQTALNSRLRFLRLLLPPTAPHVRENQAARQRRSYAERISYHSPLDPLADFEDSEDESSSDDSGIEDYVRSLSEESSNGILTDVHENDDSELHEDNEQCDTSLIYRLYNEDRALWDDDKSMNSVDDQLVQSLLKRQILSEKEVTLYLTADGNYDPMISFIARLLDVTSSGSPRRGIICCNDILPDDLTNSHLFACNIQAIVEDLHEIVEKVPTAKAQRHHICNYVQGIKPKQVIDR